MILLIASASVSFFYSSEIYRFHLKTYYRFVKKLDYNAMMTRARELYRAEKYQELRDYLKNMALIYDDRVELKRMQGMTLIKLGEERKGLDMIVTTINLDKVDPAFLHRLAELMYQYRLYQDLVSLIEKNGYGNDYSLLFYNGVSLVKTGKPAQALGHLLKVKKLGEYSLAGDRQFDLNFYLGSACEETGDLNGSLTYYLLARDLNPRDSELIKALVRIYRKKGMLKEAEKLIGR